MLLTPGAIKYYGILIKRINQILLISVSVNDTVHIKVANIKTNGNTNSCKEWNNVWQHFVECYK